MPLYSQDRDFGLCTVDVEVQAQAGAHESASGTGEASRQGSDGLSGGGIEVRTEMTQQSSVNGEPSESTSQRRLVMDV